MKHLVATRLTRRLVLAYHLLCAREDARQRHIHTPLGVWACGQCWHVSLNLAAFHTHVAVAHA